MNTKTSANSSEVSGFSLTIIGEQSPDRPELLGRDVRYVLNVKAIGQDGQVIEGVRYTVNCDLASKSLISFTGRGEEQLSTAAGENFSIYGRPPPNASYHLSMNKTLQVIVTSSDGVSTQVDYRMGRLCFWSTPDAQLSNDGHHWWVFSHTEWVGEGTGDQWHWSKNVEEAHLNIPSKGIGTSRFTSDAQGGSGYLSVRVDFPIDKGVFTAGERFRVLMPSSWNDWTATIPYEGEIQVRSE